jgi:hypothetical protein
MFTSGPQVLLIWTTAVIAWFAMVPPFTSNSRFAAPVVETPVGRSKERPAHGA